MVDVNTDKLTLSVEEAGEWLGISRAHAFKLIHENKLPCIRLGRRILVSKAGLLKMLEAAGPLAEAK